MKILLISDDNYVIDIFNEANQSSLHQTIVINDSSEPLHVMSAVCRIKPTILLIDDDFLKPNSAHILKSIKEFLNNIYVIFTTSDTGLELGREVSQIGIQYYAIKPISTTDLKDAVYSIYQLHKKIIQHV